MIDTDNGGQSTGAGPWIYDVAPDQAVSEAVVLAVASASGRPPVADSDGYGRPLDPLYEAINADALDALVQSTDVEAPVSVTFTYCGYEVAVENASQVTVREV